MKVRDWEHLLHKKIFKDFFMIWLLRFRQTYLIITLFLMTMDMFWNDKYQAIKPRHIIEELFFQNAFVYIVKKETYSPSNQKPHQ